MPAANLGSQLEKAYNLALSVRLRSLLMARGFHGGHDARSRHDCGPRSPRRDRQPRQCAGLPQPARCNRNAGQPAVHLFVSSLAPSSAGALRALEDRAGRLDERSLALAGVLNSALAHAGMTVTLGRTALPGSTA